MPRRAKPVEPLKGPRRERVAAFRLGLSAESRAAMLLIAKGYRIVARRWKTPFGEIDIVARRRRALVFVEVKSRAGIGAFSPEQAVHRDKRRHLLRVARYYRRRRGVRNPFRYDVVAIRHADQPHAEIELHRDAFREEEV